MSVEVTVRVGGLVFCLAVIKTGCIAYDIF